MKNWLMQKSTIAGLIAAVVAGLQAYTQEANIVTAIISALSVALLVFDGSRKTPPPALLLVFGLFGCASIPIPKATQAEAAAIVGCEAIALAGCFDGLQKVLPGIDKDTCRDRIGYLIEFAEDLKRSQVGSLEQARVVVEYWDPGKLDVTQLQSLTRARCKQIDRALGVVK